MGESEGKFTIHSDDVSSDDGRSNDQLENVKLEMLDEYQTTGGINLRRFVRAYPGFAAEIADYALWLRTSPQPDTDPVSSWDDEGDVALSALQSACDTIAHEASSRRTKRARRRWTHSSVLALAGQDDPVEVITARARALVVEAMDEGWSGPPFDPIALADRLKLRVVGRNDIRDARIVPVDRNRLQIEFNPNRPPARVRYSLAHEIAHALFPDCGEQIRNRTANHEIEGDEWQLEVLCNIAAAEFLMPVGTLPHLKGEELSIDRLIERKKEYEVSAEALLIRVARLADEPCAAFCATRIEKGRGLGRYRLDYTIPSETWAGDLPKSILLPTDTRVSDCTAIGYTAKSEEDWPDNIGRVYFECVGIAPYPGASFPRVVGVLRPEDMVPRQSCITYLAGDATEPGGIGPKIIAHVVNDGTPRWGAGFALALRKRWEQVQDEFISWVGEDRSRLRLGAVHEYELDESCSIIHMVAQRGYGASSAPRIRYSALRDCLQAVATQARQRGATVHMPRIGAGQAGGSWPLIEELIFSSLCAAGVQVYIYDLPGRKLVEPPQFTLDL